MTGHPRAPLLRPRDDAGERLTAAPGDGVTPEDGVSHDEQKIAPDGIVGEHVAVDAAIELFQIATAEAHYPAVTRTRAGGGLLGVAPVNFPAFCSNGRGVVREPIEVGGHDAPPAGMACTAARWLV